jgi:hypothetical protein
MSSQFEVKAIPDDTEHQYPPIPEELPQHEFTLGIIAPKGSGKTTLIVNLLKFYHGYFHRIFIFSPSVANDPKWDTILKTTGVLADNKPLERFLAKHNPKLLKVRESAPGVEIKTKGKNVEASVRYGELGRKRKWMSGGHAAEQRLLDEGHVRVVATSGGRSFLRTKLGTQLTASANSVVVERPREPEFNPAFPVGIVSAIPFTEAAAKHPTDEYVIKTRFQDRQHNASMFRKHSQMFGTFRNTKAQQHQQQDQDGSQDADDELKPLVKRGRIPQEHVFTIPKIKDLAAIMDMQQDIINELSAHGKTKFEADRILFIFDDIVGSDLLRRSKDNLRFLDLNVRHRHYAASLMIVSQGYKEIPRTFRTNFSCLVVFRISNEKERAVIYEENPNCLRYPEWLQVYNYAVKEPFHFLYITYQEKDFSKRFRKNFDTVLTINCSEYEKLSVYDQNNSSNLHSDSDNSV